MGAIQLQSRPLYGIGTVARLTGIKPDTLRIWERRYQLGASHKSASGRRQYTQSDLEHLQLVAALVADGARIGEIAASERRTLEMMLRARDESSPADIPAPKPRVLFVGRGLCDWLDEHQGCLVNVNAVLAPCALQEVDAELLAQLETVDAIVVECSGVNATRVQELEQVSDALQADSVMVLQHCSGERWRDALTAKGYQHAQFPPDPAQLAFHLARSAAEKEASVGSSNLGELMQGKPRLFSEAEISAARAIQGALTCECPRHISDLVRSLAAFEEYSSNCSVENWSDASVHACVYAYAGQARWLMEKALGHVLDAHGDALRGAD
ncbi:MAG: helix-turn-helix-type transcriptional regulator [Halioglobus sp.]|mgnify:CR=1 FL=1|nr:helix-turn-helix-type transcriptional regulator [Halioglobus sp.]